MKILFVSSYATCNSVPLLTQCKAGFGYMVYDIAKAIAQKEEGEMLLINYRYNSFDSNNIHFVGADFVAFFKNLFSCSSIAIPIRLWIKYRMQLRTVVRLFYMWLISGYYYKVIKRGGYDIVHLHGCSFNAELLIDICKRAKKPFVFTLHGLNSFSESISLEPAGKRYERDFLQRVANGEFPITVISSGIRKTIIKEYGEKAYNNVSVVCNAFSYTDKYDFDSSINVRVKYGIPNNANVILYVGNISRNKNQEQLTRAFELMPKDVCDKTYILFLGRNIEADYSLDDFVMHSRYKDHLILCGNIDKEEMPSFYQQADGVVLLSFAEGFGLSLIEGMHFGKPCMTFEDLDAYEDIYDECAVVGIKKRSDSAVAKGLQQLLSVTWNEDVIKHYSEKFESNAMSENYLKVYNQIIA